MSASKQFQTRDHEIERIEKTHETSFIFFIKVKEIVYDFYTFIRLNKVLGFLIALFFNENI
jgi:hypothetical protein